MKTKAITTVIAALLVAGTSTAALAAPGNTLERGHGPVVRQPAPAQHVTVTARPIAERAPTIHERVVHETPVRKPVYRAPVRETVVREPSYRQPIVHETVVRERGYWNHAPIIVRPRIAFEAPIPVYATPCAQLDGAETLSLGDRAGNGIELAINGGATYVQSALITYADGATQTVAIDQELDGANRALQLQTDGSPVATVTIYGNGTGVSAWMV